MPYQPVQLPGVIHQIRPNQVAFEYASSTSDTKPNVLLFVGGLGNGLANVPYVRRLVDCAEGWSIVELLLSSAYEQWGFGSVVKDAQEIGVAVEYFRSVMGKKEIVLMGHSTGSQDLMTYSQFAPTLPPVSALIFQGSVSDCEGLDPAPYSATFEAARALVAAGNGHHLIPTSYPSPGEETPVTADRFLSLWSPEGSEDFFTTTLGDDYLRAKSWGAIPSGTKILILYGGEDQFVPEAVDKEKVVERWTRIAVEAGVEVDVRNGGVVPGATHNLRDNPEEVFQDFVGRVGRFLDAVAEREVKGKL